MKKLALSLAVLAASGTYVWNQSGAASGDPLLGMSPAGADTLTKVAEPPAPVVLPPQPEPALPVKPAVATEPVPLLPAQPQIVLPKMVVAEDESAEDESYERETESETSDREMAPPAPRGADSQLTSLQDAPTPAAPPVPVAAPVMQAAPVAVASVDMPMPRPKPQMPRSAKSLLVKASMTMAASGGYADGTYTGPVSDAYYGLVQIQAIVQHGRLAGIKVLRYPSDRRTSVAINRQALPMLRDEAVAAQSANVDIISGATLTSEAFIRSLGGALRKAMA